MKTISQYQPRGLNKALGFVLIMILFFSMENAYAGKWTLSTSFSYNNANYIYAETIQSYYINLGLRYNSGDLMISAYLPFIMQNDIFSDSLLPGPLTSDHMDNTTAEHNLNSGIGDIFLYSEYRFFNPSGAIPAFYLTAQLKIPTSADLSLFSTGEFDYGIGLAARKLYGSFYVFANAGYQYFGNPPGILYRNPFSFGAGASRFFAYGKYALNLYFRTYSEIINGIEPPRQLSLGFSAALSRETILSLYLIKGFSESSPDFAFTAGLDWAL